MIRMILLACVVRFGALPAPAQDARLVALPEGDAGIAAKYPGDAGIEKDPSVFLYDGFEDVSTAEDLRKAWTGSVHHDKWIRIAEEAANIHAGKKALEFTVPQQETELANAISRKLTDEQEVLFLRFYSKFEKGFDQVGSSHNGCSISAHYFKDGKASAGKPADGTNKFLAGFECWRGEASMTKPGELNVYCYHPGQASGFGDHFFPSGKVLPNSSARSGAATFGKEFVARTDITPELDRWYCYEFMVKANTVGKRDGRIACWLDGKLIADFPGLRFRDVESLKIDYAHIGLHIGKSPRVNKKWYDDVVVAKSYIGPIGKKKK